MRVYLEQLERLGALDARWALPAHGEPIEEPATLFARYVVHRNAREAKILGVLLQHALHHKGGATARELLPDAYPDVPVGTWPIALLSVQAHLKKLVDDGRVHLQGDARYIVAS